MNIELIVLVTIGIYFLVKCIIYLINRYESVFNYAMSVSILCVLVYGISWVVKDLVQVVLK